MILCDSFVTMGKQHRVCEDYILSGYQPFQYIVLSDGCSSSKNTEMGARILCRLAKLYITKHIEDPHEVNYNEMGSWIIYNAELIGKMLGLNESALDATLIISYVADNHVYIYMYGDGFVISQGEDGDILIDSVSFKNNAPYYLSYKLNKRKLDSYLSTNPHMMRCVVVDYRSSITKYNQPIIMSRNMNRVKKVLICSDGIDSFLFEKNLEKYDLNELVKEILSFKTTKGEFLKRRMNRLINKDLTSKGVFNFDDVSVGAYINNRE